MNSRTHRTLTSEAEIVAYLHRARMAILGALRDRPSTASQIAARLGVHPANLTRHIRLLEAAGLVVLVEKRSTGRSLEKYYAAVADSFDVAPEAERLTAPHKVALAFARSDLSAALARLPDRESKPVLALVSRARLTNEDAGRFCLALKSLVESFAGADQEFGTTFHLNVSLYPGEEGSKETPPVRLTRQGGAK